MFCVRPDLDSGKKFNLVGGGGGVFCAIFQNRGVLLKFGQNFLEAWLAAASQIVSHTTSVETR